MPLDKKTLQMLADWEGKHGLDFIEQRLDDGLFSHDKDKQKLCYLWLKARRAAPWIYGVWKLLLGLAVIVGAIATLISALK